MADPATCQEEMEPQAWKGGGEVVESNGLRRLTHRWDMRVCACFALEGRCFVSEGCGDTDLVPFKAIMVVCVAFFTKHLRSHFFVKVFWQ